MQESDEKSLVEAIRSGDPDALARFIDLKRPALLGFVDRQIGAALRRKVEPDDVLQDATLEAVKRVEQAFDDPFSWMCRICEQKVIDAYRRFFGAEKRNAAREVSADDPVDSQHAGVAHLLVASLTSPSAVFSRDVKHLRMLQALESLPEDQRDVVRLRYLEGLGSKEIAERVGKSSGAVRVMLTRSLAKLQDELGSEFAPR